MTITWADLLADIRADLQDTGTVKKWDDKLLFLYAKDAIRDYSTWFPKRIDRSVLSHIGETYPLTLDFVEDIHVESPRDHFLEKRQDRPGVRYPATGKRPFYYYIQGGNLYLNGTPLDGDEVLLTYLATHPVPASETDAAFVVTVPDADVELIRLYVKAKVYSQMRSRQASLDRFKQGTGARDDNPLLPEVDDLMNDYYTAISQRVRGGVITLYRAGRTR
jgi:hypothetical protein